MVEFGHITTLETGFVAFASTTVMQACLVSVTPYLVAFVTMPWTAAEASQSMTLAEGYAAAMAATRATMATFKGRITDFRYAAIVGWAVALGTR